VLLSSAVVPDCLTSLYAVKFEEVNGDNHEIVLAKMVENCMILERMCFSFVRLRRTRNFVRFVDRALIFTDGIIMDNFSLFLFGRYETSLLDTWFSNIFNRRRAKTLRIHSHFHLSMSGLVSHSLFKNSMLELLNDLISTIKVSIMPMTIKELEFLTHSISLYDVPTPGKSIRFENLNFSNCVESTLKMTHPNPLALLCLVSYS